MGKYNAYVVTVGLAPGVYDTWIETQPLVLTVPGSAFEGFRTRAQAEQVFQDAQARGQVRTVRGFGHPRLPPLAQNIPHIPVNPVVQTPPRPPAPLIVAPAQIPPPRQRLPYAQGPSPPPSPVRSNTQVIPAQSRTVILRAPPSPPSPLPSRGSPVSVSSGEDGSFHTTRSQSTTSSPSTGVTQIEPDHFPTDSESDAESDTGRGRFRRLAPPARAPAPPLSPLSGTGNVRMFPLAGSVGLPRGPTEREPASPSLGTAVGAGRRFVIQRTPVSAPGCSRAQELVRANPAPSVRVRRGDEDGAPLSPRRVQLTAPASVPASPTLRRGGEPAPLSASRVQRTATAPASAFGEASPRASPAQGESSLARRMQRTATAPSSVFSAGSPRRNTAPAISPASSVDTISTLQLQQSPISIDGQRGGPVQAMRFRQEDRPPSTSPRSQREDVNEPPSPLQSPRRPQRTATEPALPSGAPLTRAALREHARSSPAVLSAQHDRQSAHSESAPTVPHAGGVQDYDPNLCYYNPARADVCAHCHRPRALGHGQSHDHGAIAPAYLPELPPSSAGSSATAGIARARARAQARDAAQTGGSADLLFGMTQPAHRASVVYEGAYDPRSPVPRSTPVPAYTSAPLFGRPSPTVSPVLPRSPTAPTGSHNRQRRDLLIE